MSKTHRELSKQSWTPCEKTKTSYSSIGLGCLLRIADASEAMAKNHVQLQNDYNYMRDSRDRYRDELEQERKRSAAYKGHITRLKNGKNENT